jgi:hypothetical protein
MTKVFCQNCFDNTKDVSKSVHEVTTNSKCSVCGSDAIISHEVVAGALRASERRSVDQTSEDNWSLSPLGGRGRRLLEENESHLSAANIRTLLIQYGAFDLEHWWDGCYFFRCSNFLYCMPAGESVGRYTPTLDIMLENRNGSQRYITFEVTMKLLEITDSTEFSSATQKNTP